MYKYELHCHTSESSRCGQTSASDMADFYKKAGYTGLVITDHFLNGNTTVPKDLPWEERIELYCKGYEEAKKRGDEIGLDVFFGFEFSGDFVVLGLGKEWLKEHEDLDKLVRSDFFETVHKDGGYIIHAHPFRESPYTKLLQVFPRQVDAIETINAVNTDFENNIANFIAEQYKVTKACGTDNHIGLRKTLASLEIDFRAKNIDELINAMKNNLHSVKQYDAKEEKGEVILTEHIPELDCGGRND